MANITLTLETIGPINQVISYSLFAKDGCSVLLYQVLTRWVIDISNMFRLERNDIPRLQANDPCFAGIAVKNTCIAVSYSRLYDHPHSMYFSIGDPSVLAGFNIKDQLCTFAWNERFSSFSKGYFECA